ncbi:MAG: MBL fold metallo-hydrolase [Solirubrobacteraceae bacterium]
MSAPADRLLFVGHSTLLIELGGTRVLTDPVLRARVAHLRRRVPPPVIGALTPLDAILISHAHHDHLDPPSVRGLAAGCPVLAPRGCDGILRRNGVRDVVEVAPGDRRAVGGVHVEVLASHHDGRRYPIGAAVAALGYLVEGASRVYFAGDTDLFEGMAALAGRVDVAALPIWGWGARVPPGHLDPERAAQAVALIEPAVAVPIHWGTLRAFGTQRRLDPRAPARRFARAVGRLAPRTAVRILAPGEALDL